MITVDLLQGQGRPQRSNPLHFALGTILFLIPVVTMVLAIGGFLLCRHEKQAQVTALDKIETQLAQLNDARQSVDGLQKTRKSQEEIKRELGEALPRFNQWTAVLTQLAQLTPETLLIKELEVDRTKVFKEVPNAENPDIKTRIAVPSRNLRLSLLDYLHRNEEGTVQTLIQRLSEAPQLRNQVNEIRLVAQQQEAHRDQQVTKYLMECVMRSDR